MISILFALRAALALTGIIVCIVSGKVVYEKYTRKEFDKTFRFALAIMMSWLGHILFSLMFFTGQYVFIDHAQAEQNGWTVPLVSLMLIVSGVLHLQNLTGEEHSRLWQYSILCISLMGLVVYWMVSV